MDLSLNIVFFGKCVFGKRFLGRKDQKSSILAVSFSQKSILGNIKSRFWENNSVFGKFLEPVLS
jgi:hypothetical protein